ncbi:transporter substrate-binding domain-containing protein [Tsukamurella pseudospumae]|uniref:Solute-binding protein family 3/N-terminal domain-containing protein n=1 Tax=Tsukamurella pseudospumae TaxID=239498 RepID=A0A137Z6Y5_9ACTN|nr:transporter substrate-binding domain-containing protein [Tsukamurella pseudospumae]KXO93945.1 hypothetical protein AXK61_05265 [Tsukamurella pseudospumae]
MIAAAAAVAVTLPLVAACGTTTPRSLLTSIKSGEVVLGTKYDQPGLANRNPDKSHSGSDVAVSEFVVNQIAKNNGWAAPKITWKETPSPLRERMIENGEVDMIAATYSISAARAKKVDFAGPYLTTYQALLVSKTTSNPIRSLEDLNSGRKLCSVSGSTSAINVKAALPNVQLQQYDGYASCVEGVRRGVLDALTTDATILAGFQAKYPGEFDIVPMTYPKDVTLTSSTGAKTEKKRGDQFSTERYGIGLRKGDTDALREANKALRQMMLGDEAAAAYDAEAIPARPTCVVPAALVSKYTELAYANPGNELFTALRKNLGEYADTMIDQGRPVGGGKPKSVLIAIPGDQSWLLPDTNGNVKITVDGKSVTVPKTDPQAQCTKVGA